HEQGAIPALAGGRCTRPGLPARRDVLDPARLVRTPLRRGQPELPHHRRFPDPAPRPRQPGAPARRGNRRPACRRRRALRRVGGRSRRAGGRRRRPGRTRQPGRRARRRCRAPVRARRRRRAPHLRDLPRRLELPAEAGTRARPFRAARMSKPEFLTNRAKERVGDGIRSYLRQLRETLAKPYKLDIATAYFNLGGYMLLASELDHPSQVRILLGAEPPEPERRVRKLGEPRTERQQLRHALEVHEHELRLDSDLLGFTLENATGSDRLIDWLRSDKVEVRRLRDRFLHGKAFIAFAPDDGVIAGSANFTYAGLTQNLELVLGNFTPSVVEKVRSWFDDLWEQAELYDLAALYEARFEPHTPYLIYLRMLWERYGDELALEAAASSSGVIHLTRFQEDGLWRAKRILAEHNGVLVADEVGLGKTFIAGELIREAIVERRQRVLLVAPATLRDGTWAAFKRRFQLGVETVSYDEMADSSYAYDPGEYAMVVVDEGHNLRNPSTQRAEALRRLVAGTPPKQLVLMTATPVNNSLWD